MHFMYCCAPSSAGATQPGYKGVVVVAFGSTGVYTTRLTPEDYRQMAKAWRLLNQRGYRVLWVLRENGLPEGLKLAELRARLGPDTLVVPWAHQNTLLGHPNTK
jgi:dihydrodipicolinate synthase/N-acetylneuraminate lyase